MKKYFGLLFLILLLNSCDDGDVTVEAINFDGVTAASCGEVLYKVKQNEALFIKIPAALNAFANEPTAEGTPRLIPIGGDVVVKYRAYNGTVTANNICPDVIQPIFPIAIGEWTGLSGFIEITTTPVMSAPDPVTGATKLVKYNHNIVFRNITFAKPIGQQRYDIFLFGDYATDATNLPMTLSPDVFSCSSNFTVYNAINGGIEGMYILNFEPALLATTNLGVPKTGLLGGTTAETNILFYRLLQSAIPTDTNDSYFCSYPLPTTPTIVEEWQGEKGVAGVSGIIEVTTTSFTPTSVRHSIHLKRVTFRRGNATFYYGNDIFWGDLIAPI